MIPFIIGISSGILTIALLSLLKQEDRPLAYGLILSGIGYLYVGFTWSDLASLMITCFQALVFMALAFYGTKRSLIILALGYILHGCWDLLYTMFGTPDLVPPGYDIFCSSLDFVVGIYILWYGRYSLRRA